MSKVALIVGGSTGMGKDVASRLVGNDSVAKVHIVSRNADNLAATKAELGDKIVTHAVNLKDRSAVDTFIQETIPDMGVDWLVNAAGTFAPKPFIEHTVEDYQSYMDLNQSTFFITQAVVKSMIARCGVL